MRIAHRKSGDILGEMSFVDGLPHSATVRMDGDGEVLELSYEALHQAVRRHDRIYAALLRVVVHRMRTADMAWTTGSEVPLKRVIRALESVERGERRPFRSQKELGAELGLSRATVVRTLSPLRERGLVTTGRSRISIADFEGLRALVEEGDSPGKALCLRCAT